MRRSLLTTALVLAAGALYFVGCTDNTRVPTEPPSFKKGGVPAPQARINALIRDAFSSKADRNDAQRQMARIKNALARGDIEGGQALTRVLIHFAGENADNTDAAAALAAELLAFSGISGTAVVTSGVIGSGGGDLLSLDEQAALDIPPGALSGKELISFFKKEQPCFPNEEIPEGEQADDCYTFEPVGLKFAVPVRVEVCLDETDPNVDDVRLHGRDDPDPPVVLVEEEHELIDCEGFPKFIASTGSSGIERLARAGLNRLINLFSPEPLLAANAFAPRRLGGTRGSFTDIGWALPQGEPDLEITSLTIAPFGDGAPTEDDELTYSVEVRNLGDVATVDFDVQVTLWDGVCEDLPEEDIGGKTHRVEDGLGASGEEDDSQAFDNIGFYELLETSTLPPGDYCLKAEADVESEVEGEVDLDDNINEFDFTVTVVPPVIDGVLSPGEWDDAAVTNFSVSVPGGGTTPGKLFVKNDATNLYLAVRFERAVADADNRLAFQFDNDNDGGLEDGDDSFAFAPSTGFSDRHRTSCPSPCSVTNDIAHGAGAFANDETFSVYELSHPLNSGETGKDFALTPPTTIGMFLQLRVGDGATSFTTRYPTGTFPTYVVISIIVP